MGNIRRSRGYAFEHRLVECFNELWDWKARRLGGSSTGLPDIIAVNNEKSVLLTIEAKSGTGDILYVPQDQIERCIMIRDMFGAYSERHIVFAFKFMSKKRFRRKNKTIYEQRKLVVYYKVADALVRQNPLPVVKCTYDGKTFAISGNKTIALNLPDLLVPFRNDRAK